MCLTNKIRKYVKIYTSAILVMLCQRIELCSLINTVEMDEIEQSSTKSKEVRKTFLMKVSETKSCIKVDF